MTRMILALLLLPLATTLHAQALPPAVDVTAEDYRAFIDALPRDVVSDRPIRIVDVGGYQVSVWGVFRPHSMPGTAILHERAETEIYYILDGAGVLVTGGILVDPYPSETAATSVRGTAIEGGVSRRVKSGDVIIIPGRVPHWWSSLEGDISYLIFRPDPEAHRQPR
jgi:hypothetical protein